MKRDYAGLASPLNSASVNLLLAQLSRCGEPMARLNGSWVWVSGALLKGLSPDQIRYDRCGLPCCRRCMSSRRRRNVPWRKAVDRDLEMLGPMLASDVSFVTLGDHVQARGSDFSQAADRHRYLLRNVLQRALKGCRLIAYAHLGESPAGLKLHWHGILVHPGFDRAQVKRALAGIGYRHVTPLRSNDVILEVTRCLRYSMQVSHVGLTNTEFLLLLESLTTVTGVTKAGKLGRGQRLRIGCSQPRKPKVSTATAAVPVPHVSPFHRRNLEVMKAILARKGQGSVLPIDDPVSRPSDHSSDNASGMPSMSSPVGSLIKNDLSTYECRSAGVGPSGGRPQRPVTVPANQRPQRRRRDGPPVPTGAAVSKSGYPISR